MELKALFESVNLGYVSKKNVYFELFNSFQHLEEKSSEKLSGCFPAIGLRPRTNVFILPYSMTVPGPVGLVRAVVELRQQAVHI